MLEIWGIIAGLLWWQFTPAILNPLFLSGYTPSSFVIVLSQILLFLNALFISYFWLNGTKDFLYVIWYYITRKKLFRQYAYVKSMDTSKATARVVFLYCTYNDFDETSLKKCMNQRYKNCEFVIIDDSSDKAYRDKVDEFARENGARVVRRDNRKGFKAGSINEFLNSKEMRDSYDYIVILDNDEIIPKDYVYNALKYFYAYGNVGIVQANHVSTRNRNFFMKLFHIGVNSHWLTYQTMKHSYGFTSMLGHGAMISRDCYQAAGGFPELVAEDLCISIEARNKGYYVAFAPEIVCEEEYPIDYVAFKKRHSKWTQGNMEFIKKYTKKIIKSKMSWYEKLDIILFTYNLPLTALFAFYIFLNLTLLPLLHIDVFNIYTTWMLVLTIIFFLSPMLNDFISWTFRLNPFRQLLYTIGVIILYGSMLTTSLISATMGIFGKKANFIVTPKQSKKINLWQAIKIQKNEILFSTILLILSIIFCRSALPVILIIGTGYLSIFLLFFANKTYNELDTVFIDNQTKNKLRVR